MKKSYFVRALALLLALCCVLPIGAMATEDEPPITYVYPDDWSRAALMFAVNNGILAGDHEHNLNPQFNITRAEIAAVLVRMLGATQKADLSAYTDVDPSAWYYNELSSAVATGIFTGISDTEMQPGAPLTREQAVVVLTRAFGLVSEDREAYQKFSDKDSIALYALDGVNAMVNHGFIAGYDDGTMRPKANITRAEVAQLIYNIFDRIANKPAQIPEKGFILYRGTEPLPDTLQLDGTLILAQAYPGTLTPASWDITGSLVIRCAKVDTVNLDGVKAGNLVFAPLSGNLTGSFEKLYLGGNSDLTGSAKELNLLRGTHTVQGDCEKLTLLEGAKANVNGQVTVGLTASSGSDLTMSGNLPSAVFAPQAKALIQGDVAKLELGAQSVVRCTGTVGEVTFGRGCALTLDKDVGDLTISEMDVHLTLNGHANSVYVGNYMVTIDGTGSIGTLSYVSTTVCTLPCDEKISLAELEYNIDYYSALETVQTCKIPVVLKLDLSLYTDRGYGDVIRVLPAGTVVYNEWWPDGSWIYVSTAEKEYGWIRYNYVYIDEEHMVFDGQYDYSVGTKEGFVNLKNYASKTNYLIWVNRYTQKVLIFEGTQGAWKLIRTCLCGTGSAFTPTPEGFYEVYKKETLWNFGDYVTTSVTRFNAGMAFHSYLRKHNGQPYNSTLSVPISHGCVRMDPVDAQFIWDNIPYGTAVVVY